MASMYIQEYRDIAKDEAGFVVQAGKEPAIATQKVTYTSSTASAAFHQDTRFVRITCDAEAHLAFGVAPTATANSMNMQADTPEFFGVVGGQKVAAYDGTT